VRNRIRARTLDSLRCPRCRLHTDLCACDLLVPIPVATELLLVAHRYEIRKPTNTGQLAVLCLQGARLCLRGRHGSPDDPVTWGKGRTPLYLFPCPDAVPLDEWKAAHPERAHTVTLIVPDGTWRQTKRVRRRVPGLLDVQAVCLPGVAPSAYRLRRTSVADRLATLEAIARAFGVLEGPAPEAHLDRAFRIVIERALWSNGRLGSEDLTDALPAGARQHGPADRGKPRTRPVRRSAP
jgi:DTW domain-containing protein